jgi:hypothetical protein
MNGKINSCCITAGDLLMMIMGLPAGLLMLFVGLFVCSIFGCSICHVGTVLLKSAIANGAVEADLLGDLQMSIVLFAIGAFITGVSSKIVSASLRRCLKVRQNNLHEAH